ncbi:MAG: hypothetical protein M1828_002511 [Chrysothrix sp. TS-e1954]|nr:MAG: hypothetical protein M1828_002511 [Chrysothrix sp. TS-e1954]
MPLLQDPSQKYRKFKPLHLPNRQWPSKSVDKVPRWLSTDLRDGNQSLIDPMDGAQKRMYFDMLVKLGYKEIEISFPSASETDFDFTQDIIRNPTTSLDDVWIQVLSPCRKDFIKRTVEAARGAKNAILHLYLATSPCFQRIVFNMTNEQSKALAVECTKYARSITKDSPDQEIRKTNWRYEFSPETFSDSDPAFAVEVCEAVRREWQPTVEDKLIFNMPATVEMSTPNVYADQIEYFCTNMPQATRDTFCVSLHPHNDRGCAVAAAELAQMAGADRVEGCLFGNGERTGNVDLVTLALNLYTQGIHPGIDFSDLNPIIALVEKCNKIPIHPRAPYGGDLVVCAFSGSHQDAINKGFKDREARLASHPLGPASQQALQETTWEIPYLPLDPKDIGRSYEAIIRVNSQSGKGGVAWVIKRTLDLDLPRGLQVAFSRIVQARADAIGRELLPREIQNLFEDAYHVGPALAASSAVESASGLPTTFGARLNLVDYDMTSDRTASPARIKDDGKTIRSDNYRRRFDGIIEVDGKVEKEIKGTGNGPLSSLANALGSLGVRVEVCDYAEHSISQGAAAGEGSHVKAVAYVEVRGVREHSGKEGDGKRVWGVGINSDVTQASLQAMLSACSEFLPVEGEAPELEGARGRSTKGATSLEVPSGRANGIPLRHANGNTQ